MTSLIEENADQVIVTIKEEGNKVIGGFTFALHRASTTAGCYHRVVRALGIGPALQGDGEGGQRFSEMVRVALCSMSIEAIRQRYVALGSDEKLEDFVAREQARILDVTTDLLDDEVGMIVHALEQSGIVCVFHKLVDVMRDRGILIEGALNMHTHVHSETGRKIFGSCGNWTTADDGIQENCIVTRTVACFPRRSVAHMSKLLAEQVAIMGVEETNRRLGDVYDGLVMERERLGSMIQGVRAQISHSKAEHAKVSAECEKSSSSVQSMLALSKGEADVAIAELERTSAQLKALQASTALKKTEIADATHRLTTLSKQSLAIARRIEGAASNNLVAEAEAAKEHDRSVKAVRATTDEIGKLKGRLKALTGDKDALVGAIDDLVGGNDRLLKDKERLAEDKGQLTKDKERLTKEQERLIEQNERLAKEIHELEGTRVGLDETKKSLETTKESLRAEHAAMTSEKRRMERELADHHASYWKKQQWTTYLQQNIDHVAATYNATLVALNAGKDRLASAEAELSAVTWRLGECEQTLAQYRLRIQTANETVLAMAKNVWGAEMQADIERSKFHAKSHAKMQAAE